MDSELHKYASPSGVRSEEEVEDEDLDRYSEDEYGGFPSMGRPSAVQNEDDYDYAIELTPDDEYRKSAQVLGNITDFEDADEYIENLIHDMLEKDDEKEILKKNRNSKGRHSRSSSSRSASEGCDAVRRSSASISKNKDSYEAPVRDKDGFPTGKKNSKSFFDYVFGRSGGADKQDKHSDDEAEDDSRDSRANNSGSGSGDVEAGAYSSPYGSPENHKDTNGRAPQLGHSPLQRAVSLRTQALLEQKTKSERNSSTTEDSAQTNQYMHNPFDSTDSSSHDTDEDNNGLTPTEAITYIGKRQLLSRIGVLGKKKKWVEKAARR